MEARPSERALGRSGGAGGAPENGSPADAYAATAVAGADETGVLATSDCERSADTATPRNDVSNGASRQHP